MISKKDVGRKFKAIINRVNAAHSDEQVGADFLDLVEAAMDAVIEKQIGDDKEMADDVRAIRESPWAKELFRNLEK